MPVVQANGIDIYYEVQGEGEPWSLSRTWPLTRRVMRSRWPTREDYTCFTVDLRSAGLSGKPEGRYGHQLFADDVAAFMQAAGLDRAHVSGLSLGAATGMWLAAKYPDRVTSLSLHSASPATDPFLRTVVEGWRIMAQGLGSVTDMVIRGIFPWCFTPELSAARPGLHRIELADFVRSRPMPPVDAFLRESQAVLDHDARAVLASVQAPTLITFGGHDQVTSTRFADPLTQGMGVTRRSWCSRTARTPRSTRTSRRSTSAPWTSLNRHPG